MTADDLLKLPDGEKQLELVAGRVRERHKSQFASQAAGRLLTKLHDLADTRGGWLFGWGLGYSCFPTGDVRRASMTYLRRERMPAELADRDVPYMPLAPDLVADTRTPIATDAEVEADATAWLAAGASEFWDVDPVERRVRVFVPSGPARWLRAADTLATPLLPGFAVPVADLFRRPSAPPPAAVS